jgi:hypothetical protein
MTILMNSEAEKNKENRPLSTEADSGQHPANPQRKFFIERQPTAQRVSQISDSDTDSQPQPTTRQPAKRTRQDSEELPENDDAAAVDEDDVSEDAGFESVSETIQVGHVRKRAKLHVVSHDHAGNAKSRQPRTNATASKWGQHTSASRPRERVASVSPDPASDVANTGRAADMYSVVRETAQRQGQVHRLTTGAQRVTQTRVKWTPEEENGFISLIDRFGCSWSDLLARGQDEGIFHETRNQVSLKDKARNMKVDFLV